MQEFLGLLLETFELSQIVVDANECLDFAFEALACFLFAIPAFYIAANTTLASSNNVLILFIILKADGLVIGWEHLLILCDSFAEICIEKVTHAVIGERCRFFNLSTDVLPFAGFSGEI